MAAPKTLRVAAVLFRIQVAPHLVVQLLSVGVTAESEERVQSDTIVHLLEIALAMAPVVLFSRTQMVHVRMGTISDVPDVDIVSPTLILALLPHLRHRVIVRAIKSEMIMEIALTHNAVLIRPLIVMEIVSTLLSRPAPVAKSEMIMEIVLTVDVQPIRL